jgi:peptidoglycan/LPS O-acetylase OafA/YrhL
MTLAPWQADPMHSTGENWKLGRRPALDGLRGVAIALVLLAHSQHGFAESSGAVGVTAFFTLSGFLITSGLLEQIDGAGHVSLKRFWSRRVRRLVPALWLYVLATSVLSALGVVGFITSPPVIITTLVYALNWVRAFVAVPESVAITWSLAVEEQFYLLWPLAFLAARRWPRFPIYAAAVGVLVAPLLRFAMWGSGGGADRIYYGTQGHMDALLLGCLLAYWVRTRRSLPRWAAPVAWAVLVGCSLASRGAFSILALPTLVPLASCALIVWCMSPRAAMTNPAARWLGQRSYGIYLFHYPLLMIVTPIYGVPVWVTLPAALLVSEVSYRFVEQPFLRRGHAKEAPAHPKVDEGLSVTL